MITTDEFFESPRSWSLLKYRVLDGYLAAYFPKVNQAYLRPAVAADLFAGRGRFEDGTEGSPLIIARHAKYWGEKLRYRNQVVLAEVKAEDREILVENMKDFINEGIAVIIPGDALDVGQVLLERIKPGVPLFVFLDPFGLKGLSMKLLMEIFRRAKQESTEVLINFNHRAIARRLGVCRKVNDPRHQIRKLAETTIEFTNDILGGSWWQAIMNDTSVSEDARVELIRKKYVNIYASNFPHIGTMPVTQGLPGESVKYFLIFASRSQVAFELMNDVMKKAWFQFMLEVINEQNVGTLFQDSTPQQFATSETATKLEALAEEVFEEAVRLVRTQAPYYRKISDIPLRRREVRIGLISRQFARYTCSEYNDAIKMLLQKGRLVAPDNRVRISDNVAFALGESA